MNIPAVVLSEAHKTPMNEDEPTLPSSEVSKLWQEAARELSRRLLECARIKQRCMDVLDTKGAKRAYALVNELTALIRVLDSLLTMEPEFAAVLCRQSVDRIMKIYEESSSLFTIG